MTQLYEHNTNNNNNNNTLSVLSEEGVVSGSQPGNQSKMANNNFGIVGSSSSQNGPTSGSSTPPSMASLPLSMHNKNNIGHQNLNQPEQQQQQQPQTYQNQNGFQNGNNNGFGNFGQNYQEFGQNKDFGFHNEMNQKNDFIKNVNSMDFNQFDSNDFQRNNNNNRQQNNFLQNSSTNPHGFNMNSQQQQQNLNSSVPAQMSNFINNNAVAAASNNQKRDTNSLYKTELCRSYVETGSCRYGNKCQFAHGDEEIRNLSRHPKYKTEMCRSFHTTGHCPYGIRCHFIHDQINPTKNQAPNRQSPQQQQQNMGTQSMQNNLNNMNQQQNNMGNHNSYNNFNSVWSGGVSMADRMKNNNNNTNNSNVTISHESSNRFDSSGVFTQNNSNNCWSNVVRNDSNNDIFANSGNNNNFRTPVKFDMGWNENKNKNKQLEQQQQQPQQVADNTWGSGFAGKFGDNSNKTDNSGFGFSSNLDWGSKSVEKPKSQSSIFSDSIFSNPSSNNKINSNPSRFDTAWSTNIETSNEKKLSSERTPSSSIFDQNNNPMDDDFNPTGFFNDVFSQMNVQDNKTAQQKSSQECSIFGGSSLFESNNKRVNNSTDSW